MVVRKLLGRRAGRVKELAPAVAAAAIVIICSYAVAANAERISTVGPGIFGLVVLLNAAGYGAGWYLAKLYRFDRRHRLTLAVEIGMQNAGLGVVLALEHFGPQTALPAALFAAWCVLTAAGATTYLRRRGEGVRAFSAATRPAGGGNGAERLDWSQPYDDNELS
jgi:BASS family bile acid:Na+ symporter